MVHNFFYYNMLYYIIYFISKKIITTIFTNLNLVNLEKNNNNKLVNCIKYEIAIQLQLDPNISHIPLEKNNINLASHIYPVMSKTKKVVHSQHITINFK